MNILFNTSRCVSLSASGPMEEKSRLSTDTACPCLLCLLSQKHTYFVTTNASVPVFRGKPGQGPNNMKQSKGFLVQKLVYEFLYPQTVHFALYENMLSLLQACLYFSWPLHIFRVIDNRPQHSIVPCLRETLVVCSCHVLIMSKRFRGLQQSAFSLEQAFLTSVLHSLLISKTVKKNWYNLTRSRASVSTVAHPY